ncbi:MAG: IPT/TIG domain-containing protein [Pseudomonadales bacterium]
MTDLQRFPNLYVDEGGGNVPWVNPGNILTDNGQKASVSVTTGSYGTKTSGWLRLGFDLSGVPEGSLISAVSLGLDELTKSTNTTGASLCYIEYWNGTVWVPISTTYVQIGAGAFSGSGPSSVALPVLSRSVLEGWADGFGVRIRLADGSASGSVSIDAVSVTVTYGPPPAPTVTAIDPDTGAAAGGTAVTITGTGFQSEDQDVVSGVTIGGVACTEVSVQSDTTLTCVTGAHAGGAVDVVVTNPGGSGTLTNGFTYLSVVDALVKVVNGGSVAGSSAASADAWPENPGEQVYGGPTELWDSLTIADVNASDFGFVLQATVGAGAEARVDYMAARFYYTVQGLNDPASFVSVLRVESDRATSRPDLYQLPRAGFAVSNDPTIDRRVRSGASFWTSRRFAPSRNVEKIWHSRELWLDESVQGNTPGLQIWARVDEGVAFQLLDASGLPATLRGTGPKEVFFPKGDQARGYYLQLEYRIPTLAAGQVPAAYSWREGATHLLCRPKRTWKETFSLALGGGEFEDKTGQVASAETQLERLIALAKPGVPPIAYREPNGRTGYCSVTDLEWRELVNKEGPKANTYLANVTLRMARYE